MKQRTSQTTKGFTLLEVLVAAAVLSIGSVTFLWALEQSRGTLARNSQALEAAVLAESLLDQYRLGTIDSAGALSGRSNWRWQAESQNTPQGRELSLTVAWPGGLYALKTLAGEEQ